METNPPMPQLPPPKRPSDEIGASTHIPKKPKVSSKPSIADSDDELEMAKQPPKGPLDRIFKSQKHQIAEDILFVLKNAPEYNYENLPLGVIPTTLKINEIGLRRCS